MHGREGERRIHRRHMWSDPVPATSSVATTKFAAITPDSFTKDGRKICVGDCALFKPPHESPPFIGIIRRVILEKEDSLSLCVSWIYRPADVKLGKGALLEAAPNEVFYSFHQDEILAASLLHPCKVAFLRKGVELPSGISAFVCRRVYDIDNKCLWWLTDQDYINSYFWTQGRQEEVDKLLDKTRIEMHGAVQSGGRSPKPLNGATGTSFKPSSDSVHSSTSSFASQVKGKKRDRGDQGSDPSKRERFSRADDADSGQFRPENLLKSEIAKITDRGGLVDFEGVEKLVQLMQPDSAEKKIDLACRIMLVDVLSVTDRFDCLGQFVQLRGLPVLDEWLQEVHKGKIGDGISPKESDKSAEDFLFALLRALDKLPVNLHALQTCNVGKSVNHLRGHKNIEIQKKARSLVDTWKKRVEAEMNVLDAKPAPNRGGSWPTKPMLSEVGNRRSGGSSEFGTKINISQSSAGKMQLVKLGSGDAAAKFAPVSPGATKSSASMSTSGTVTTKDFNPAMYVGGGTSDPPMSTIKEEKSSSSSHSQNNSQSCSSEHTKTGSSCREDARSSTAGSVSVNKMATSSSRHRKLNNGQHRSPVSGVQKETSLGKISSSNRNLTSGKDSPTAIAYERLSDVPTMDHGSNHRLIVRLPNTGRSPGRSANGGSSVEAFCKVSPSAHPEKLDNPDQKVKGKNDALRSGSVSNVNMNPRQDQDGFAGTDEDHGPSTAAICDAQKCSEDSGKLTDVPRKAVSSPRVTSKAHKPYEAFSSMNALVESCVRFSEAVATASAGDDVGMNLLASVAAAEIPRSDVAPFESGGNLSVPDDSCSGNGVKLRNLDEDITTSKDRHNDGANSGGPLVHVKNESQPMPVLTGVSTDGKVVQVGSEDKTMKGSSLPNSSSELRHSVQGQCSTSDRKSFEPVTDKSVVMSSANAATEEGSGEVEGASRFHDRRESGVEQLKGNSFLNSKLKSRSSSLDENKKAVTADAKNVDDSVVVPEVATIGSKCGKGEDDVSPSCSSSDMCRDDKSNIVHKAADGGSNLHEQLPKIAEKIVLDPKGEKKEDAELPWGGTILVTESKVKNHSEKTEKSKQDPGSDNYSAYSDKAERKDVLNHCPGLLPKEEFVATPVRETEQCMTSGGKIGEEAEAIGTEASPSRKNASSSPVVGSNMAVKLDFDLNEGFPGDDGSSGELPKPSVPICSSAAHLPCPLQFPVSSVSVSGGFPASITVAAAAKGPFFPPENPLKSRGGLGWKGSAATSAFRPAEPRKVLEMPFGLTDVPFVDSSMSKPARPRLDIDLNVADDLGEVACSQSGPRDSTGGVLDLDLNRLDEGPEIGQLSVSNSCRMEIISQLPCRSSVSGGLSNIALNPMRGFDLNNGPNAEEVCTDAAPPPTKGGNSNIMPLLSHIPPGVRMTSTDLGNFSSWFPPGNAYSAMAIPSILSGRGGEQNYPIVPAAGSQRFMGPASGGNYFGSEIYRGPVLSSCPAVTPFQYPGFPFETNFPLASNSYNNSAAAYLESSSGASLCFPAIPSQQLVGPAAGAPSSHYPRPFFMSMPSGGPTSNVGGENRKWGNQALDLNAGPGGVGSDFERRDERLLPSAAALMRHQQQQQQQQQLPVVSSQALTEEQLKFYQMAGGVLKRKEPDRDTDRISSSYKQQPSWQ